MSAMLLIYTAVIVPVQICMWNYDDPCNMFPTLFFDVFVDAFFMVGSISSSVADESDSTPIDVTLDAALSAREAQ